MSEITTGVFIGNKEFASSEELLSEYKISRVVSLGCSVPAFDGITYLSISSVLDTPETLLLDFFMDTTSFIASCVKESEPVLIHCVYGQSRSATVVCAYLVSIGHSLSSSLALLSDKNPGTCINPGFLAQLYYFAEQPYFRMTAEFTLMKQSCCKEQLLHHIEKKASTSASEEHGNVLVCRKCRYLLAPEDSILVRSHETAAFVTRYLDGFWRGYQPARAKALGPLMRLPIKASWAVCPSTWMLSQTMGEESPINGAAESDGGSAVGMKTDIDVDKEAKHASKEETQLTCPRCGAEVGAFRAKQLDLIGIYNPCDLYTLSEAAVRKHRKRPLPAISF